MRYLPIILLVCGLFAAFQVSSESKDEKIPFLKVGSQSYTNVEVLNVSATDLFILHSRGSANVKLKDLTPELQRKFGYDTNKAVASQTGSSPAPGNSGTQQSAPPSVQPQTQGSPAPAQGSSSEPRSKKVVSDLKIEKWVSEEPNLDHKFKLIHFWYSSARLCLGVIPKYNALHDEYSSHMAIIAISRESELQVRPFTRKHLRYYSAVDPADRLRKELDINNHLCYAILVDPQGRIRWEGYPDQLERELLEHVLFGPSN